MVRGPVFVGGTSGVTRIELSGFATCSPIRVLTHPDLRRVPRVARFERFMADRFDACEGRFWGAKDAPALVAPAAKWS